MHHLRVEIREGDARERLNDLLYDDIAEDVPSRGMVARKEFLRRVEAVLWPNVIHVYYVEEDGENPVCYYWSREGEGKI